MVKLKDIKGDCIMDINQQLKEIIAEIISHEVQISDIYDETVLTVDLGFNSIQIVNLIVELETKYNIDIEDDDLDIENLTVYKNLFDMVSEKLKIQGDNVDDC